MMSQSAQPKLVLIHGFCESQEIFHHLLPELSKAADVFTLDLPGFGGRPYDPRIKRMDDMAHWLRDWMDENRLDKINLVGHSMGGYVAIAFAELYPERLERLGLLHSTTLADTETRKENRTKSHDFIARHGLDAFLDVFVASLFLQPNDGWFATLKAIGQKADTEAVKAMTLAMRDRPDRSYVAAKLLVPLMYLIGEADPLIPYERSQAELAQIGMGLVHIIRGAGHMGMYENPTSTTEGILQLLQLPA